MKKDISFLFSEYQYFGNKLVILENFVRSSFTLILLQFFEW